MNASLQQVLALIDAANTADPQQTEWQGKAYPKALLYGQRMSACLATFAPQASELVQIAVRAQHIERWNIPRDSYPQGRAGYLKWRSDLGRYHAQRTAELMAETGYAEDDCQRVAQLLQKKRLKQDAEVQLLEDVACLVFLQSYFAEFAAKHSEAKLIDIIQKTWAKMSDDGRKQALELDLPEQHLALIGAALK